MTGSSTIHATSGVQEKLTGMTRLIDNTINTVRRISSELRPGILDDLGLVAAIQWQAQNFQARTGIICNCASLFETAGLDRDRSTAVFRIFQEILTNVLRHAEATLVNVDILLDDCDLVLEVRDNGKGIKGEKSSNQRSLGLLGMQERSRLFGGEVTVTGTEGKGTTVRVRMPIE